MLRQQHMAANTGEVTNLILLRTTSNVMVIVLLIPCPLIALIQSSAASYINSSYFQTTAFGRFRPCLCQVLDAVDRHLLTFVVSTILNHNNVGDLPTISLLRKSLYMCVKSSLKRGYGRRKWLSKKALISCWLIAHLEIFARC